MAKYSRYWRQLASLFAGIFLAAFVFSGCDLLGGTKVKDYAGQLDTEIAWANAKKLTVTVTHPDDWGSSPQDGTGRCGDVRQNYSFNIEFNPMPGFGFEKWLAFPADVYSSLDMTKSAADVEGSSLNGHGVDIVESVSISGTKSAIVTIHTTEPVTLVPWCCVRPGITQSNPPLISSGSTYSRGQVIKIWFSTELAYENNGEIGFGTDLIQITGQDAGTGEPYNAADENGNLAGFFETPTYSANEKAITITPKQGNPPPQNLNITVTVGTGVLGKNGNGMAAVVKFSYQTNDTIIKQVYNADNVWAIDNPTATSTESDFFYRGADTGRDRRLVTKSGANFVVTLFFRVSRSVNTVTPEEPEKVTVAEIDYATMDGSEKNPSNPRRTIDFSGSMLTAVSTSAGADSVYRQYNPDPTGTGGYYYYRVVYTIPDTTDSGIIRLVVLPGSTAFPADTWQNAVAEGRFVEVVLDKLAPGGNASINLGGQADITNSVYNYNTSNPTLSVTGNFSGITDNAGFGIQKIAATRDKPWTMDDQASLQWQFCIVNDGTTPGASNLLTSAWYALDSTTRSQSLSTLPSSQTVRNVYVQYKDTLGNTSGWSSPMGKITYSTTTINPVSGWSAVYSDTGNSIALTWTPPSGVTRVEVWVNGILRTGVADTAAAYTITSVPAINKSGIASGQPVSNVMEYDISLNAVYPTGSAATSFKIWNIPGMAAGTIAPYHVITEISTAAQLASVAVGNSTAQYALINDIEITGPCTPIGTGSDTNSFQGKFYGNGHTIIVSGGFADAAYTGIFGYASGTTAEIRDLTVHYSSNTTPGTSAAWTGGLVGYADKGAKLSNIIVRGAGGVALTHSVSATDRYYGGIVGYMDGSGTTIDNAYCALNFNLSSSSPAIYAGGIAGCINGSGAGSLTNCLWAAGANLAVPRCAGDLYAGGIAGNISGGTGTGTFSVSGCFARGDMDLRNLGGTVNAGGVLGFLASSDTVNSIRVDNCVYEQGSAFVQSIAQATSAANVGGIIARSNQLGVFTNCYSRALKLELDVSSANTRFGGFAGFMGLGSTASSCGSTSPVLMANVGQPTTGSVYIGGFVGYLSNANTALALCWAEGQVSSQGAGDQSTGGLVGYSDATASGSNHTIFQCYASGKVDAVSMNVNILAGINAGGLVGYVVNAKVSQSRASGAVTVTREQPGQISAGGLIGFNNDTASGNSTFDNCYALGNVLVDNPRITAGGVLVIAGGLIGRAVNGTTTYCFCKGSVEGRNASNSGEGQIDLGGLVGYLDGGNNITRSCAFGTSIIAKGCTVNNMHRVIGSIPAGQVSTLGNNYAISTMVIGSTTTYAGVVQGSPVNSSTDPQYGSGSQQGENFGNTTDWTATNKLAFNNITNCWNTSTIGTLGYPRLAWEF